MRRILGTTMTMTMLLLAGSASAQNLLAEMTETGRFEHFLAGLRSAGLEDRLAGPVTVFAPTDAAYEAAVTPELQAAFEDDPALARRVLLTHIAEGVVYPADALPRTVDVTSGETLTVEFTGNRLLVTVDDASEVSDVVAIRGGEIRIGNSIAHPLDGILLPQDATLAALSRPADEAEGARNPDLVTPDGVPVPEDGSYLDELVGGPEPEALEEAPSSREETGSTDGSAGSVTGPDAGGEVDGADVTLVTPDADALRSARGAAETVTTYVPMDENGVEAGIVIEEMNVTVEETPRVEPRTVAPSRMMNGAALGSEAEGQPSMSSDDGPDGAASGEAGGMPDQEASRFAASQEGSEEAFLLQNIVGWPVYAESGVQIGDVRNVIILRNTGAVDGFLVEIGGFLGLDIGTRLVRLDLDEARIDVADEAVVTSLSEGEMSEREEYRGPELNP
ncbi:fasciclin domain-containing protein [uncultured Jannaschia sp.]|uniref:fasciclin domain-containing protein n=1 Tax=uncultured Jannaschia sp. TaxID=293347 RepID=UPI00263918EF|nr:fasciclin domain-containing protein [uncultured Jannaschia sp.]